METESDNGIFSRLGLQGSQSVENAVRIFTGRLELIRQVLPGVGRINQITWEGQCTRLGTGESLYWNDGVIALRSAPALELKVG